MTTRVSPRFGAILVSKKKFLQAFGKTETDLKCKDAIRELGLALGMGNASFGITRLEGESPFLILHTNAERSINPGKEPENHYYHPVHSREPHLLKKLDTLNIPVYGAASYGKIEEHAKQLHIIA